MKIISFYNDPWEADYLKGKLSGHDIVFYEGSLQDNPDIKDDSAEVLSVFVKSQVGAAEFDRFPAIKHVVTRSTGFDHIDLKEAEKRGITVANVPTYGENTVAEFAFALITMLARRTYEAYDRVVTTSSFSPKGLMGFDLKGKTIGVVGTGHIGQYSIRIAHGFGMEILAFDLHHDDQFAKEIGFSYVELEDLLSRSDIITLHLPLNKHTEHLLNKDNVRKIKKGAYLINTARGPLVDTDALILALKEEILAGAGMDVLEEEGYMLDEMKLLIDEHPNAEALQTMLQNHYLIDHPRVIITPHMAFNTKEARERILDTTIENIMSYSAGEPKNVVKPKA